MIILPGIAKTAHHHKNPCLTHDSQQTNGPWNSLVGLLCDPAATGACTQSPGSRCWVGPVTISSLYSVDFVTQRILFRRLAQSKIPSSTPNSRQTPSRVVDTPPPNVLPILASQRAAGYARPSNLIMSSIVYSASKEDLVSRFIISVMQDFNQSQHSKQGSDWVRYVGRAVLATRVEAMGLGARGKTGGNLGKVTSRHPTALMGKSEGNLNI